MSDTPSRIDVINKFLWTDWSSRSHRDCFGGTLRVYRECARIRYWTWTDSTGETVHTGSVPLY